MTEALPTADASAQREALARGDTTAVALATGYLDAIERAQPSVNAYIAIDRERTLAEARSSDARRAALGARPLEGLAIAIKDNLDAAGWRTTAGMGTRRDAPVAPQDSAAMERLRAAGAVLLGKLNLHEAALGADNDNPHFGACHHPRRHGFTPGGSSGGSGAAVAAALCSVALGTDSMGSVRIPAAYCGVFGLKPTFGAISPRGSVVVSRRLDHVGVLARSARDLGLLLTVLAGYDAACAESRAVVFAPPHPGVLRFGVPALDGVALQPAVREAFARGLDALRARGHAVVDLAASRIEPGKARRAGLLVCEAEMLVEHGADWTAHRERFSPALAKMLAWASGKSAADFAAADRVLDEAAVQLRQWLEACDLVAMPTAPQVAFAFGGEVPANQADLTCFANMAGLPAISLPLPVAEDDWPVGLQLIGHAGDDLRLVALAHALTT
jgi:aspartyl-tRNA(Asn)/glutamyl-tRNA(Gln) amidotransferase subunit A